jgi:hypothetical protein
MYWHDPGTIGTLIRNGWNESPDSLVKVVRNIHLLLHTVKPFGVPRQSRGFT